MNKWSIIRHSGEVFFFMAVLIYIPINSAWIFYCPHILLRDFYNHHTLNVVRWYITVISICISPKFVFLFGLCLFIAFVNFQIMWNYFCPSLSSLCILDITSLWWASLFFLVSRLFLYSIYCFLLPADAFWFSTITSVCFKFHFLCLYIFLLFSVLLDSYSRVIAFTN